MRVNADTVTDITGKAGFIAGAAPPPAPDTQEMIEAIRAQLRRRLSDLKAGRPAEFNKKALPEDALPRALARAKKDLADFEEMIRSVPQGFSLRPVFYARISKDEKEKIRRHFDNNVRPSFLKHLADNFAPALRALGICDNGIARLRQGLDARDEQRRYYELSVDHIIECAGSGNWGRTLSVDALRGNDAPPAPQANHFDNLILLTETLHRFKNRLNTIQAIENVAIGQGRWVLMMVPDAATGFVATPQAAGSKLAGIGFRPETAVAKASRLSWFSGYAATVLQAFAAVPATEALLQSYAALAQNAGRQVCDMANDNTAAGRTLTEVFTEAVENPDAARRARRMLFELADTINDTLRAASDATSADGKKALAILSDIIDVSPLAELEKLAARLPFDSGQTLRSSFHAARLAIGAEKARQANEKAARERDRRDRQSARDRGRNDGNGHRKGGRRRR